MTRRPIRIRALRFLALLGIFGLIAACAPAPSPSPAAPASKPAAATQAPAKGDSRLGPPPTTKPIDRVIKIGYPGKIGFNHSLSYIGWDTMREAGWKFEEVAFSNMGGLVQGAATGEADCGWLGDAARLAAMDKDPSVRLVALTENQGNIWVLYGKKSINDFKELKGRPVAQGTVGQINDFLLNMTIAKYSTEPQIIRFNDSEQRTRALIAGQVDMALLGADDTIVAERAKPGEFKTLIRYKDEFPDIAGSYFSCNGKFIDQYPDAVQAMVDFWILNYRRAYEDPAWFLAAVKKKLSETPDATLKESYDLFIKNGFWDPNGNMGQKTIQATYKTYQDNGVFKRDIKLSEFADTRFIENTLKKYGEYKPKS